MRKILILRWLLPLIILIGCGEATPLDEHPLRQLLQKQLTETATAQKIYHKVVKDLQQTEAEVEIQDIQLSVDSTAQDFGILETELYYALAYVYNAAPDSNFLQVQKSNDTILAYPSAESGTPPYLNMQKILLSPDGKYIRYIESKVDKENWLYDNHVHIKVKFDSLGYYQQHDLEVLTHIKLVDREIHGLIQGNIQNE